MYFAALLGSENFGQLHNTPTKIPLVDQMPFGCGICLAVSNKIVICLCAFLLGNCQERQLVESIAIHLPCLWRNAFAKEYAPLLDRSFAYNACHQFVYIYIYVYTKIQLLSAPKSRDSLWLRWRFLPLPRKIAIFRLEDARFPSDPRSLRTAIFFAIKAGETDAHCGNPCDTAVKIASEWRCTIFGTSPKLGIACFDVGQPSLQRQVAEGVFPVRYDRCWLPNKLSLRNPGLSCLPSNSAVKQRGQQRKGPTEIIQKFRLRTAVSGEIVL